MKIKLIVIILFTLFPLKAYALSFHPIIGINSIYTNINDPNFHYTDKWNPADITSINTGLSLNHNNFITGISTTRLFHRPSEREVKSNKSGHSYKNRTTIITDSIYFGYQIKRFQPALFITNARVEKGLYQNNTIIAETNQSAILYGVSLGYFLTKNVEALLIYIAPNKELYLESGLGFGFNYVF
tara:strand:+ start:701 stop:1255 length:555 start_codon:yes stop_codon:yes gene_type:complete